MALEALKVVDVILVIQDDGEREALTELMRSHPQVRVAEHASARTAIASLREFSAQAVACSTTLGDANWQQLAKLLHSGHFGPSDVPLCVLCEADEAVAIQTMADAHTHAVVRSDDERVAGQIIQIAASRPRHSVLVVEDEPLVAQLARRALEKDFDVEIANDGASALAAWHARRHELVLLDLMLPDISGAEVAEKLRHENPNQPIVVVTAHPSSENHQKLILGGASQFLSKPIDPHALLMVCAQTLRAVHLGELLETAEHRAKVLRSLGGQVRVASYHLNRGQADHASRDLRRAMRQWPHSLTDDEWADLLAQSADWPSSS